MKHFIQVIVLRRIVFLNIIKSYRIHSILSIRLYKQEFYIVMMIREYMVRISLSVRQNIGIKG